MQANSPEPDFDTSPRAENDANYRNPGTPDYQNFDLEPYMDNLEDQLDDQHEDDVLLGEQLDHYDYNEQPMDGDYFEEDPNEPTTSNAYYSDVDGICCDSEVMDPKSHGKPLKCSVCSMKLNTNEALLAHMTCHTGRKQYPCTVPGCSRIFGNQSTLDLHINKWHRRASATEEVIQCVWMTGRRVCNLLCLTQTDLDEHVKSEHVNKVEKIACGWQMCKRAGQIFSDRYKFAQHVDTHLKPFKCVFCNMRYHSSDDLLQHVEVHMDSDLHEPDAKLYENTADYTEEYADVDASSVPSSSYSNQYVAAQSEEPETSDYWGASHSNQGEDRSEPPLQAEFTDLQDLPYHKSAEASSYDSQGSIFYDQELQEQFRQKTVSSGPTGLQDYLGFEPVETSPFSSQGSIFYDQELGMPPARVEPQEHLSQETLPYGSNDFRNFRGTRNTKTFAYNSQGSIVHDQQQATQAEFYADPGLTDHQKPISHHQEFGRNKQSGQAKPAEHLSQESLPSGRLLSLNQGIGPGEHQCLWVTDGEVCLKSFQKPTDLRDHICEVHRYDLIFCSWRGCDRSTRPFKKRKDLLYHLRVHTGVMPHTCFWMTDGEVCVKSFQKRNDLRDHICGVHLERYQGVVCSWKGCERKSTPLKRKICLLNHLQVHTGEKPYTCLWVTGDQVCMQKCRTSEIMEHIKLFHTRESKCFECCWQGCEHKKPFESHRELTCHLRAHIGLRSFRCDTCHREFSHLGSLFNHKNRGRGCPALAPPMGPPTKVFCSPVEYNLSYQDLGTHYEDPGLEDQEATHNDHQQLLEKQPTRINRKALMELNQHQAPHHEQHFLEASTGPFYSEQVIDERVRFEEPQIYGEGCSGQGFSGAPVEYSNPSGQDLRAHCEDPGLESPEFEIAMQNMGNLSQNRQHCLGGSAYSTGPVISDSLAPRYKRPIPPLPKSDDSYKPVHKRVDQSEFDYDDLVDENNPVRIPNQNQCLWNLNGQLCLQTSQTPSELQDHVRLVHLNRPPHICLWKDCKRWLIPYSSKKVLLNHLREHTGNKVFTCRTCKEFFGDPDSLRSHTREIHTKQRTFECTACGEVVSGYLAFIAHKRAHFEENQESEDIIYVGSHYQQPPLEKQPNYGFSSQGSSGAPVEEYSNPSEQQNLGAHYEDLEDQPIENMNPEHYQNSRTSIPSGHVCYNLSNIPQWEDNNKIDE